MFSLLQVRWFKNLTMISYGITVYKDRSKFKIEKPAVDEWNLVIKNVEPSDEAIYKCKTVEDGIERETARSLKVESKQFSYFSFVCLLLLVFCKRRLVSLPKQNFHMLFYLTDVFLATGKMVHCQVLQDGS